MFVEDLTPLFADFGEPVTVNGTAAVAIVNLASEVVLGDVITVAPSLELPATVDAAAGQACTVRNVAYTIRQVIDLPPDGVVRQLVLARS